MASPAANVPLRVLPTRPGRSVRRGHSLLYFYLIRAARASRGPGFARQVHLPSHRGFLPLDHPAPSADPLRSREAARLGRVDLALTAAGSMLVGDLLPGLERPLIPATNGIEIAAAKAREEAGKETAPPLGEDARLALLPETLALRLGVSQGAGTARLFSAHANRPSTMWRPGFTSIRSMLSGA